MKPIAAGPAVCWLALGLGAMPSDFGGRLDIHQSDNVIEGEYSDAKAMTLLFGQYDAERKTSPVEPTPEERKLLQGPTDGNEAETFVAAPAFSSPVYQQSGRERRMLIFAVAPERYGCRPCAPMLGGAVFVKSPEGWRMAGLTRGIQQVGSYGLAPENGKLIRLGEDRYGVFFEVGDIGQGIFGSAWHVLAEVDGKLVAALELFQVAGNNRGAVRSPRWQYASQYRAAPGGDPDWYDFIVTTSGTRPNKAGRVVRVAETRRFVFRNGRYEEAVAR